MNQGLNPVKNINIEFEERETQKRAKQLDFDYINISGFPINPDILKLVEFDVCKEAQAIPFYRNAKKLKIAVFDPSLESTKKLIDFFEKKGFEVKIFICSLRALDQAFHLFNSKFLNKKSIKVRKNFDEKESETFESQFISFSDLEDRIKNYPTEKVLNEIEIFALRNRASDIHLQPSESEVVLRFRIDGILHDICKIEYETAKLLISRIKYESGMKSNISDIPQDGHLHFLANGRKVDLRVSSLPTEHLESIVMRVLDSRKGIKNFEDLGFSSGIREKIKTILRQKDGMILVTGPTGSGKTTTLYSMLSEINDSAKKIVTLEDPIEYHLENVTQSQVDEKRDYNFSTGLKALLRHDPDMILIGEIREYSTAKLSSEAALTGHLVFSSLHTNSAIGALTRLRNLGLESYNISASINAIFAQRLLRKICPYCAEKEKINLADFPRVEASIERIKKIYPELGQKIKMRKTASSETESDEIETNFEVENLKAVGCEKCSHTGFSGQTAICETFILDEILKQKIADGETEMEIKSFVQSNTDFLSLFDDGIRKVLLGETALSEVFRVVF